VCGRERNRKEGSEERTGRLRALEVDVAGLSGQRKDPYRGSRTPGEDRVCLKARHWQSVGEGIGEEEIAQD